MQAVHTLLRRRGVEAGSGRVGASDGELGDRVAFEQRRREHGRSFRLHLTEQVAGVVETEVRRTALATSLTVGRQQVAVSRRQPRDNRSARSAGEVLTGRRCKRATAGGGSSTTEHAHGA